MGQAIKAVQIANGASLSGAEFLEGGSLVGIIVDAGFDGASLTLQSAHDNVTYKNVFDKNGNEYVITIQPNRFQPIPALDLPGLRYVKIRSGTSALPVAQIALRTLQLVIER